MDEKNIYLPHAGLIFFSVANGPKLIPLTSNNEMFNSLNSLNSNLLSSLSFMLLITQDYSNYFNKYSVDKGTLICPFRACGFVKSSHKCCFFHCSSFMHRIMLILVMNFGNGTFNCRETALPKY